MDSPLAPVDPITLAVVSGALDNSVREMTITMRRAAMSPVLAIGNDFSNAIFDGKARLVMQGQDQPVHVGALIFACKVCRMCNRMSFHAHCAARSSYRLPARKWSMPRGSPSA